MIIPMVCFTCGKPISHLWDKYNYIIQYITYLRESPSESDGFTLNIRDIEINITNDHIRSENDPSKTPEYIALKILKITRQCCRRMFLCHTDRYNDISN